jgi:hypothetical protein
VSFRSKAVAMLAARWSRVALALIAPLLKRLNTPEAFGLETLFMG